MPKMLFRYINYVDTKSGKPVYWVNKRLEYFHNYWSFLFQKTSRLLFITLERFESHKALLIKLNNQLEHNPYKGLKTIKTIINHPYFDDSNVFLQSDSNLKSLINQYKIEFFSNWQKKINKANNGKTTATEELQALVKKEILMQSGSGGRGTKYIMHLLLNDN